jgi:hypothetical protein
MSSKNTPTKLAKPRRGRPPTLKANDDPSNHCRICKCLFKLQYGNDEKMKQVSTKNPFKPSMCKDMKERCTLAEMCLAIGITILMHKDFSTRVCKPCGRKIRNANACYMFIRSNLANESPMNVTPKTSPTTLPVRYKRVLPTTVTTPERNPRPTKNKSSSPAVKSLNYENICKDYH